MADILPIILLGLAGFLLGGVYATWKTARGLAVLLAAAAVLAVAGGIGWLYWG
ncbi:hypothetical protein IQ251_07140 [Saccharopolyspora sp. HNM0983]|uniref:Amidotransferase n=1 Tax=Saccharopolyspora montiporae TaxID=2781240 RepID=A0A929B6N5_9PSEU|nr:hypothetical protein [Saccharopolyspora sp. HNM0983]MBE9374219.1 hypothetical protein [Saccharopolyspora sp. HNM0983]